MKPQGEEAILDYSVETWPDKEWEALTTASGRIPGPHLPTLGFSVRVWSDPRGLQVQCGDVVEVR